MPRWIVNNLGLKLLSLCLAALLWAVVLGEQKIEVTVSVPLQLDVPPKMFLVNDPAETLEVRLRGPKTLVTSVTPREIMLGEWPVKLVEGENTVPIREEWIRVPRGIQVVDVNPRRVRVVLERAVEREVEVNPRVEGRPPDGYAVRQVTANPPRVRMVGPATEMARVTRVRTLPINVTGQTASFSARTLLEPVGRQVRVEDNVTIMVQVDIEEKKS